MSIYVVGVDGGTTKTVALVADNTGRILGAGRGGNSNWVGTDVEQPMKKTTFGGPKRTVPVLVFETPDALGQVLAKDILQAIATAKEAGRTFLLGCPGGRSLQTTYQALGEQARLASADLSHLVIVMMDEYVFAQGDVFVYGPGDAHYSCRRFAREEIWAVLNAGLSKACRIPAQNLWFPDPADPSNYDTRLEAAGGIDLFLLASGASDGHVAFNPPGSTVDSQTRIIPLADSTRRDNMATFPNFQSLNEVPKYGVSVGLGTICSLSQRAVLVIHGAYKQGAVRRLAGCVDFTPDWPASLIYRCQGGQIWLDQPAAA
jgi:glucosamine-6-phosphate deaminase